jgi:hypothetical protein
LVGLNFLLSKRIVYGNLFFIKQKWCSVNCLFAPLQLRYIFALSNENKQQFTLLKSQIMKSFKIKPALVVIALGTATLVSCKKEKTVVPEQQVPAAKTIEGSWAGKYGSGNKEPNVYFAFNIKPQGVLEVKNEQGEITGSGTWKLTDEDIFEASYSYTQNLVVIYSLTAKYDKEAETLNGSWAPSIGLGGGDFFLNKN